MQLLRRSISGRRYLRISAQVSVAANGTSTPPEAIDPAFCDPRSFPVAVGALGVVATFADS